MITQWVWFTLALVVAAGCALAAVWLWLGQAWRTDELEDIYDAARETEGPEALGLLREDVLTMLPKCGVEQTLLAHAIIQYIDIKLMPPQ